MKNHFFVFSFLIVSIFSCKKDDASQIIANVKDIKKKEIIFSNINKSWVFNAKPSNATAQDLTTQWTEWRLFLDELSKKPKSTIGAFQEKAKNLSKKAADLNLNVPAQFSNQAIFSRITVLQTKVNMLELYINLMQIPDAKVVGLVSQINTEVAILQAQMNEITVKSKIKIEDGEQDLIMMMDTARAVPSAPVELQ
jgi:hypothetical protein